MFGHHAVMFAGGGPLFFPLVLVIAVVVVLYAVRRRDDRASRSADTEAVALLTEVRATLTRLEERVRNLETLLEADAPKGGRS